MNSRLAHLIAIVLFFFCFTSDLDAEKIKGRVFSVETNEPLTGASIYFNGTTIGAFADENGAFELPYDSLFSEIIVSFLGYETLSYNISPGEWAKPLKFLLQDATEELEVVDISATRTRSWQNNLNTFKSLFIGYSEFSKLTELLNPEALYFDKNRETGILKAFARATLKIENKALGYLIEYDLDSFEYTQRTGHMSLLGYTKFTKLSGSKREEKKWVRNRDAAYKGSFPHFLHTLQKDKLKKTKFAIRQLKRIPNPERPSDQDILQARKSLRQIKASKEKEIKAVRDSLQDVVSKRGLPKTISLLSKKKYDPSPHLKFSNESTFLSFEDFWQVTYNEYGAIQTSIISLLTPRIVFDKYGTVQNPLDIMFEDYWVSETTAYLLPLDFLKVQALNE